MATSYIFFNDTATTEIYTLSLHDALPISLRIAVDLDGTLADMDAALQAEAERLFGPGVDARPPVAPPAGTRLTDRQQRQLWGRVHEIENFWEGLAEIEPGAVRSEEHTSELQSRQYLVCRLL